MHIPPELEKLAANEDEAPGSEVPTVVIDAEGAAPRAELTLREFIFEHRGTIVGCACLCVVLVAVVLWRVYP